MAGILFKHEITELITLTTTPNQKCTQYHKRMPVFILPQHKDYWFSSTVDQLAPLMKAIPEQMINVN